ncbi:MAG: exodeoxyribonuclease III [Alphaproteobacteria bacterium]|nr:exodeoxyribonuclease III [Alphaproteobacteria bacterium]
MRLTTWNVNGLRAAVRKGFGDFVDRVAPDVLLLQEIRVTPDQLDAMWRAPDGWHVVWHPAEKPGYSGTAVWSRHPIEVLGTGLDDADPEGRVVRVRTCGVQVASVYLPSGSSSEARQQAKEAWMARFAPWSWALLASHVDEPLLLGGDLNIAHTERDIWNAKSNAKTSGFLPHERAWFGELLGGGWHDVVREQVGDVQGPYAWWSNRGRARELDRGWRIDYLLANDAAASRVRAVDTLREGGLVVSDHAPVSVDLDV